jgi:hypothetical protein
MRKSRVKEKIVRKKRTTKARRKRLAHATTAEQRGILRSIAGRKILH